MPASLVARISQARDLILDRAIAFHEAQPLRTAKRGRKTAALITASRSASGSTKKECLRFLTDPRTWLTNDEAERDFRIARLRQGISGGFRIILPAVIATARSRNN